MSAATVEPPTNPVAGSKPYTAPASQIWSWAVGRLAEGGLIMTFGQAMTIFTVGFGLSPVIVSWCMMLPRLVDGILDPIIGHWSDDSRSRWGRRKPFLLGGAVLGAVFLASLWWASPGWQPTTQFLYLGIIGTCVYLCYGTYTMAWNAIGYELTDDYHERSKVAGIAGFFLTAMGLALSWMYWLALRPMFGGVIWGMRWIGGAMAVVIVISALVVVRGTRERFAHTNRIHVPILPAIRTTLRNRPFVILIMMRLCEVFGGRLSGGIAFYVGVYYTCQGDQALASKIAGIGGTIGVVWNFAILPFMKPISQQIGKRGALIIGAAIGFAMALVTPFITTPAHPYWGIMAAIIVTPLLVISQTISNAILPDICDLDELQNGQRREGLFTSVMGFVSKLEISLAVVLVGYVVSFSAVDTTIGLRWDQSIDDKDGAVAGFAPGEKAIYAFKDEQTATFDTFSVVAPENDGKRVKEVELSAGDVSTTGAFRPIGRFQVEGSQPITFAPVTARFFKVHLVSARDGGGVIALNEFSLVNSAAGASTPGNLLATANGGKVRATTPPDRILNKLFWLAMLPAIVFTGLTLLATLKFPMTEASMMEVRRQLDERRLAQAAAGVPTDTVAEEIVHESPEITEAALGENARRSHANEHPL